MNVFGGSVSSKLGYLRAVVGTLQAFEEDKVSLQDCNKALLLVCMERSEKIEEGISLYLSVVVEEEGSYGDLRRMRDYKSALELQFPNDCHKIKCIKEFRSISGLGLKEAKEWVLDNLYPEGNE